MRMRLPRFLAFFALLSSPAFAQSYTTMQWGLDKTASPYAFGANIGGTWRNLGTVSSVGAWQIPMSNIRGLFNVVDYGADATGVADSTTAIRNTITAAGSNPVYLPAGTFKITDQITLNSGQTMSCAGRTQTKLYVPATFNLGATAVVNLGAPGSDKIPGSILDCGVSFYQPPSATSRSDIIAYPPAIYAGGGFKISQGRFQIDRVRVSGGSKCLVATGDNGGSYIGRLECGGFSTDGMIDIDGSADFVHVDSIECWPYDFSATAAMLNIYTDQSTVCAKIGRVDGLSIDKLATYAASVKFTSNAANGLAMNVTNMQLDGDGANLSNAGAALQIGNLYTTKTASSATTSGFIAISGGTTTISNVNIIDGNVQQGVVVTGGTIQINGGYWRHFNPANYGLNVTGGTAIVQNTFLDPRNAGGTIDNRSAAFFFQNGASSALQLSNNSTLPSGGATGNFVVFNTDVAKNLYQNNNFGAWASGYAGVVNGNYGATYSANTWSAAQTFSGAATFNSTVKLATYTIATLPPCGASLLGSLATVSNGLGWPTTWGTAGNAVPAGFPGTAVSATGAVTRSVICTNTGGATTYAWAYN